MKDKKKGLDVVIAVGEPVKGGAKGKGPMCDMCEGEGCPFCEEDDKGKDMEDEEYDDFEEEDGEDIEIPEDEEEMDMEEESPAVGVLDAIASKDPTMFEESLRAMIEKIMAEKA